MKELGVMPPVGYVIAIPLEAEPMVFAYGIDPADDERLWTWLHGDRAGWKDVLADAMELDLAAQERTSRRSPEPDREEPAA